MSVLVCGASAFAQQISVQAVLESQEAYVGAPVGFQIQVTGSSRPAHPNLNALKNNFTVTQTGAGPQRSQSLTIINGKTTRVVKNDYVFSYTVTPKHEGAFIIPAIAVNIDGRQYLTQKTSITAKKPAETDDFKLVLKLSKSRCYAGEPIVLNIIWYLNKDVRGFDITLPILENTDLFFADMNIDGVKIHLLCVLKGTGLETLYNNREIKILSMEEYVETVCDFLEILPSSTTIHRLAGNGLRKIRVAPVWLNEKFKVLNMIDRELEKRNSFQGKYYIQ